MFRLVEVGPIDDQREIAVLRAGCAESRRLGIQDQYSDVVKLLRKNQLYAASKTQAVLLRDQTKLLDLLRNNRWAHDAEIERRWLLSFFDGVRTAKLLHHNILAVGKKVSWIDLRNWRGNGENLTRVLLIASTPSHDYQFLVHQLSRDRATVADAILQTAAPGTEQDVHQLLDRFPTTEDELARYDTIVAFDPDWESLDRGETDDNRPTALLERWVAERAGGLILVAGPENMDKLAEYPLNTTVLDLYPIKLIHRPRQGEMQDIFGRESPGEIEFTREGLDAEFLRLGDSAAASRRAWTDFGGIYACYRGFEAKKEATVYARFCDPDVGRKDIGLIFMASQPYGAGRVFYLGSGQLWRLRASDESNFARVYSQIMRFASDGRLFDDSRFGIRFARDVASEIDETCELYLRAQEPLSVRLLRPFLKSALDAEAQRAVKRLNDLDDFHAVRERLEDIRDSEVKLDVATRKLQKESLPLLGD